MNNQFTPTSKLNITIYFSESPESCYSIFSSETISFLLDIIEKTRGINFLEFYERPDKSGWHFSFKDKDYPLTHFFSNSIIKGYAFKTQYSLDIFKLLPSELNIFNMLAIRNQENGSSSTEIKAFDIIKNVLSDNNLNRKQKTLYILAYEILINPKIKSKLSQKGIYDIRSNILLDFSFDYLIFLLEHQANLFQVKMRMLQKSNMAIVPGQKDINLLYWAVRSGNFQLTEYLLNTNQGGEINQRKASNGNSSLHIASLFQYNDIVKLLLESGAEKKRLNSEGLLPQTMNKSTELKKVYSNFDNNQIYKTLKTLRNKDKIKYVRLIKDNQDHIIAKKCRLTSFSCKYGYVNVWCIGKIEFMEELLLNEIIENPHYFQGKTQETIQLNEISGPKNSSRKGTTNRTEVSHISGESLKEIFEKNGTLSENLKYFLVNLNSLPKITVSNENWIGLLEMRIIKNKALNTNENNSMQKGNLSGREYDSTNNNKAIRSLSQKPRKKVLEENLTKFQLDEDIIYPYALWFIKENYFRSMDPKDVIKQLRLGTKVYKGDYQLLIHPKKKLVDLRVIHQKRKVIIEADELATLNEMAYYICYELEINNNLSPNLKFIYLNQKLDRNKKLTDIYKEYFKDKMKMTFDVELIL